MCGRRPGWDLNGTVPVAKAARRVAVVGLDRLGWHRIEQLGLRDDWSVVALTDARPDRRALARVSRTEVVDTIDELLTVPELDGVIITEPPAQRRELVERCLDARVSVWLEAPLSDDLRQVRRFQTLARERGVQVRVLQPRRFDTAYRQAVSMLQSGRLGQLRSIRLVSAEWTAFAGDEGAPACPLTDPVEQFGPHGFDQLVGMVPSDPHWVWARRCSGEDGFLAVVCFTCGTTAQIEIRRRARATCQTGWVLEGENASFQQGRLISVANDGELIDELVTPPPLSDDPLHLSLAGDDVNPQEQQRRAWLTVGLTLAVQRASQRNTSIRWDEVVGG